MFKDIEKSKKQIIDNLIEKLNEELASVEEAATSAKEYATQDDLKSEGKYDTRAIEASYLASAQNKRVEELKLDIKMLEDLLVDVRDSETLQLGSVGLIKHNGQERVYFLSSTSGGSLININETPILVISVFSPIGNAALGYAKGEIFEVETPKETRSYEVLAVY